MRLLFLIGGFPPGVVGGAELQAEAWACRLARRHVVQVLTRRNHASAEGEECRDGFVVRRVEVSRLPIWRTLQDLRRAERYVAAMDPKPDLMICFQTFISGLAGVWIQARHGVPAVVWVRGEDEVRTGWLDRSRWIAPRVWQAAAGVLVQSQRVHDVLLDGLRLVAPAALESVRAKLEVVPNGLVLPPVAAGPGHGVLAVGRLIHDKGVDTVIEAAALAGLPLTIAGDGPERSNLERLAAVRGGEVHFEGMVSRERLQELYRSAACVALASRRGEGLPNVLLEAMAHGRPVVATPVMGVTDLVCRGENGLLVSPDDVQAFAAAFARVANDADLAARLAAGARATAGAFEWERVEPRLEVALQRWRSK